MEIKSFFTPVTSMACVATIPGSGAACFRKYRYAPMPITAVTSRLSTPVMLLIPKLYAHAKSVEECLGQVCSSVHPRYHPSARDRLESAGSGDCRGNLSRERALDAAGIHRGHHIEVRQSGLDRGVCIGHCSDQS